MAESVVPVGGALGTVAVGEETFEKIAAVPESGLHHSETFSGIRLRRERRSGDSGKADRVPVHFPGHPPERGALSGDDPVERLKDPPSELRLKAGGDRGRKIIPEQPENRCQAPSGQSGRQIDLDRFPGEVEQFLIVRRQDPRREIADFSDQRLQLFEIDPFSSCIICGGEHCQSTGILIVNALIAGPVSRFPEIQIQLREREREILKQNPVRAGDGRLHGWRIDQRLFLSGRKIFSGDPR